MTSLARAWLHAVTSGRFLSVWSAAVAFPVSVTVLGLYPLTTGETFAEFVSLAVVWAVLVLVLLPVARAAARARSATGRAVPALVAVVLCSAIRPPLNDVVLALITGADTVAAPWAWRAVTNVVAWLVILSAVAMLRHTLVATHASTQRLAAVLEALRGVEQRSRDAAVAAESLLAQCRRALAAELPALTSVDAVVRFSTGPVRVWNRRITGAAHTSSGTAAPAAPSTPAARPPLALRLPPIGLVTALYTLMSLPYALRALSPAVTAAAFALTVTMGLAADIVPRRLPRRVSAVRRMQAWLALAVAQGLLLSVFAVLVVTVPAFETGIPLFVVPAVAVGASLCTGLVRGERAQERRLVSATRRHRYALVTRASGAQRALLDASRLLHRDLQGACIAFAARYPLATPEELSALRTDAARMLAGLRADPAASEPAPVASLRGVLESWSRAIEVESVVPPEVHEALEQSPATAQDAVEIVTEGLINAVKHGEGLRATVHAALLRTGGGPMLGLAVRSDGAPAAGTVLRPDSRVAMLGGILSVREGRTELSAVLPLPAVVPAEHSASAPKGAG